jgi:DNA-binding Xre family transcriptional regulator
MSYRLRVREIAEQKEFTQSKVSFKTELAFKTVRTLWHNPYTDVQLSTLARIARALGVSVTDLIEDIPEPQQSEPH